MQFFATEFDILQAGRDRRLYAFTCANRERHFQSMLGRETTGTATASVREERICG